MSKRMPNRILFFGLLCCLFSPHVADNPAIINLDKCGIDCSVVRCQNPECAGGTVPDQCACCPVCAKQIGETCGIPEKTYGKCDEQLYCQIPDGSNTGTCAGCPQVLCTKDAYEKCNGVYQRDKNGCNTCNCICPEVSNCALIKCRFGVIKTVDENGCEICHCKAQVPSCSYNGKFFKPGDTRYEQCNICTCGKNGIWACTKKGCPTGFCYFLGNQILNGQSFFDGCNQCTCIAKNKTQYGNILCTLKFCTANCSLIYCPKTCPNGYQTDKNNCPTCNCSLFCPLFPAVNGPECGEEGSLPCLPDECQRDSDCPFGKKCCVSGGIKGSPRKCIPPVPFPIGK